MRSTVTLSSSSSSWTRMILLVTAALCLPACSGSSCAEGTSAAAPDEQNPKGEAASEPQPELAEPLIVDVTAAADPLLTGRLAAFHVTVSGGPGGASHMSGTFGQKRASLTAWDDDGRRWLALAPVDVDEERRQLELRLDATLSDETPVVVSRLFAVAEAPYESSEISVSRRFLSPSKAQQRRAANERERIKKALTTWSEERLWRGSFLRPTLTEETSPFGTRRTLNGKKQSRHLGWDLDGKTGDAILAAQRGRAVLVDELFYSGGTVVLDHGRGLFTLYFHMSAFDVKPGELVERGQLLGKVGKTGRVTGPHLHFGVKLDDTYVDPKQVLALDLDADPLAPPEERLATTDEQAPEAATP